jgi:hypothetical protein
MSVISLALSSHIKKWPSPVFEKETIWKFGEL